jgi:guanine deaminase
MTSAMDKAVFEARKGVEKGDGGPFGAVIVRGDEVLAAAHNEVLIRNDPTAHAEILAIRAAAAAAESPHLDGCTLYTTCEPCPMCLAAIHWARIDRVIYAETRQDAAKIGFDDERFHEAMRNPLMPIEHVQDENAAKLFAEYDGARY